MGDGAALDAQAFQFDLKLSQKDVIGERVPIAEQGPSKVIHEARNGCAD